jgi:hypothetical protein
VLSIGGRWVQTDVTQERNRTAIGGRGLAWAFLALLAFLGPVGCPPGGGTPQSHPEALVVYNVNAGADAAEIAAHYATRRGIPAANLCPVELPPGHYASKDHLLAARKQIVETCICGTIPAAARPSPCSLANLNAVRLASAITHLAIVRGVPARLYGTPWPSDAEEPSFDFYLAYSLYRTQDLFAAGSTGVPQASYLTADLLAQGSEGMILSAPPLSTADSIDVAYGRVEAIDKSRTIQLVDRTLDAERRGITGNFFEEKNNKDFRFLVDTTGSHAPECSGYISYNPFLPGTAESTWQGSSCRAGTTWTSAKGPDNNSTADDPIRSVLPGTWMSTVPWAINTSLMLGSAPNPNGQAGFNDFTTLLGWRKSTADCTALCAEHPTQAERDACAAASTDYFRELDTSCVGGARGLIGHQVRSYPVQYYGFFPPDWTTNGGGGGEKTPPEIRSGGGYQDETFTDDRYLHFGHHGVGDPDVSTCTLENGTVASCPESIAVNLSHRAVVEPAVPVSGNRFYAVYLRHRNAASPGGWLGVTLTFEGGAAPVTKSSGLSLDQESQDWQTELLFFSVSSAETPSVNAVTVTLSAGLGDQVTGFLDLDAIEVVDLNGWTSLVPASAGSFDPAARNVTHGGDWAANAIDRLGAVAWWGSSSHHVSNGWGWSDEGRFYGAFFMGRTLGESLLLMAGGEAGIAYGDPLYRPSAVRIHIPGQGGYGKAPGRSVGPADIGLHVVLLEVLHGMANTGVTKWSLESCTTLDPALCAGQWVVRASGTGAKTGFPVDWTPFLTDPGVSQDLLLRLRVWNPGQEADELRHHAYFHWVP